jgi:hypothetical protein
MKTNHLRHVLLRASVPQLEAVIDWLDRPWAPGRNDALRAAWHESRRSDGARRALAYALEEEIRSLPSGRDIALVASRLGVDPSPQAVIDEIARRLDASSVWSLPFTQRQIMDALRAGAEIAGAVLTAHASRRSHRRRWRHAR